MRRPAIPPRVTRLLPLLASPIDGEALNTRDAILKTLAAVGLDLNDLAAVISAAGEPSPIARRDATAAPGFFDMARACRDRDRGRLEARERTFVADMVRKGSLPPSPRQAQWLGDIFAKLQQKRAAA